MCMSAGFRRSLRLCRRWRGQAFGTSQFCTLRCPTSCYSSLANPYEEVVQYQHHPEHPHRLIALLGECVSRAKISQKNTHITLCACTLSCMFWNGILLSGPSGVGVNELRRRLIEINPKVYQGAVPREFHSTRSTHMTLCDITVYCWFWSWLSYPLRYYTAT